MLVIKKIALLGLVLIALNFIYKQFAFTAFVEQYADQYLQVDKIKDCDVIYVSASSNFPPENIPENDPRKISQFVSDHFPSLRFEAINKPASHAGVYRHLLALFPEESEAKTFVIAINLRSFGPSWINSELETALNQSNVFYNQRPVLLNRFLLSLNSYDNASAEERSATIQHHWSVDELPFPAPKNTVNNWCAVEKWGDWRNPKRQLADQFIKQFGFVIDAENPRVKDFDAMCEVGRARNISIVFNLLAENIETADSLVGRDLTHLMRQNTAWLVDRYTSKGFRLVDNLDVLRERNFTDKDFPTEHYDEEGRKIIAKNVAEALKELHP